MNIVLLDHDTLGEIESINRFKEYGEFKSYPTTSSTEVLSRIANAEIVITNKVVIGQREMDAAKELKLICVAATGTNNIDLDYAAKKGIQVKNVKGYSTESVAQQTFAMILHLANHVSYYHDYVASGKYSKGTIFTHLDKPVFELNGKVMGIIGMGTIGQRVAQIAQAFGMKVIYYSTSGKNQQAGYKSVSLDELLSTSDVVSIHAPLNPATDSLLNYEAMSKMKPTAYLVNNGRGGIVVEEDLMEILMEDKIRGAALDVFAKEPLSADSSLLDIKNSDRLLLFPHTAWSSVEARTTLVEGIHENIRSFIKVDQG
jgi:lactate dehydrogenase-like 2-hydroxyacid dehydrogenase